MIIRTNLSLCAKCMDNPHYDVAKDGECDCTVDMDVCRICHNGPLNAGEDLCDEHKAIAT